MRLHRFYTVQPLGEEVGIDDVSTIKQWTKVLRYGVGDLVILFNGDGHDYTYEITTVEKTFCKLLLKKKQLSIVPEKELVLCLALIKAQNFELVVQKAVELGVKTIVPILSERSEKKHVSLERLKKIIIEATEQCGRGDIAELHNPTTLKDALSLWQESHDIYVAHTHVETEKFPRKGKTMALFIGPEGGWGERDMELFKAHKNLHTLSLGETVLRAETAGIIGIWELLKNTP